MTDDDVAGLITDLDALIDRVQADGLPRHIISKIQAVQEMIYLVILKDREW